MILTLTPNPAVDITWHVDHLTPGGTHRVPPAVARAGGKGLNVARVLHASGVPVIALTTAGGATGDQFRTELAAAGVPCELVATASATRLSAAIVDAGSGETFVLNEVGAALTAEETAELVATALRLGRAAGVVAISGSLRDGFGPDELASLVASLAGETRVVVDTSGPGMLAAARAGAHVLKPNREELAAATGLADPLAGAHALLELGAGLIVVSLGTEGLMVVPREGAPVRARLPRVLHGNPTGAGDAAVAAIAAALSTGDDLFSDTAAAHRARRDLARRATAWSAAAVLTPQAGELSPEHTTLADEVELTTIDGDDR